VASAIPALEERCGDAASYCDPHDPGDIAAKVLALLRDPQQRRTLVERGRARVRPYTWERCAAQTRSVIEAVLGERGGA
jgi:glycosyltransferase involved in cell wall biosynthesis